VGIQGSPGGRSAGSRTRHWLEVDTPGLVQQEWSDGTSVSFRDPAVSFQDARLTALVKANAATEAAHDVFEKLKGQMAASNPLRFFLLIDALQRMMRMQGAGAHGYDALQESVGGILTSLDPEVVMSRREAELSEQDFTAMELLVRQLAGHASQARVGEYLEDKDERGIDARFLLAAEEQFDRTAGYTENLRLIALDVLTQVDDLEPEVGFRLADVVRAADAQLDDQLLRLQDIDDGPHPDREDSQQVSAASGRSNAFGVLERVASVIRHDPVPVVAVALELDSSVALRLVDSLATPLGSQDVASLTRSSRLRQFPAIKLPDGSYIWTNPQDCLHEILEWADLYLADRARPALRQRLSRARAATTERLTAQVLAGVYGAERVMRNLEYCEADGRWIETDVVVDLGAAAVIVEAKSQRLTPQGRSAAAGRVRTKVDEFLVRPLSQTSRARAALLEGACIRTQRGDVRSLKPSVVRRLIVNLDRVDPFVTHARSLVSAARYETHALATDAWIVSLADLLAVTHLLRTSTELWAYHGKRAAQTATGSPAVLMETDALGAWFRTREGAWPVKEGQLFQLAFSSEEINAYYNYRDFVSRGAEVDEVPPPTSRIPDVVLSAMTSLVDSADWAVAADAIGNVPPSEWDRFRRQMRRLASAPRTRHQRRALQAAERGVAYGGQPRVIIQPGDAVRLEVSSEFRNLSRSLPDVVGEEGDVSVVTLIVPRSASAV
jgi:hypothetical protein